MNLTAYVVILGLSAPLCACGSLPASPAPTPKPIETSQSRLPVTEAGCHPISMEERKEASSEIGILIGRNSAAVLPKWASQFIALRKKACNLSGEGEAK